MGKETKLTTPPKEIFLEELYLEQNTIDPISNHFVEKIEESTKIVEISFSESEIGFRGDIFIDGKSLGHFSIKKIDEGRAYISDIQVGYDDQSQYDFRNKGFGLKIYKQIIKELYQRKIKLNSTNFSISFTAISPQALRVWEKLLEEDLVIKIGEVMGKIHDRFTGETEVKMIPLYESKVSA